MQPQRIAIIGASGGIGYALTNQLARDYPDALIHAFSRSDTSFDAPNVKTGFIDIEEEATIEAAANQAAQDGPIDLILVTVGLLHDDGLMPEKALRDLSAEKFERLFAVNTIGPALVAKHFLPHIPKEAPSHFAAISARVGSICDNRVGGWYAYRASKAALNMVIKNASIEMARRYKHAIIIGLHPGTVDTGLSKPFQSAVANSKLFTAEQSAAYLMDVLRDLTPDDSGKCFAWDGQEILP